MMSKKVFMIFNNNFDKRKQALWFVNMFIKEEYRDTGYLLNVSQLIIQDQCAISCDRESDSDRWVWITDFDALSYTRGMTQIFYPTKNLGEL